eukprot:9647498-Karenia_brevis.AAC.1
MAKVIAECRTQLKANNCCIDLSEYSDLICSTFAVGYDTVCHDLCNSDVSFVDDAMFAVMGDADSIIGKTQR